MFEARWTAADPNIGDCIVIRGSRVISVVSVAAVFVCLCLAYGTLQPPPGGCRSCASPAGPSLAFWAVAALVCGIVAFSTWRTRLAIGARGFRWDKPLRPLQAPLEVLWSQVDCCGVDASHASRSARYRLVVVLSDKSEVRIGGEFLARGFSTSWWDICDLMEDKRRANQRALFRPA